MEIDHRKAFPIKDRRQMSFGQCDADGVREALPQWAGRHLDAARQMVLRMSRCQAAILPEVLQLIERHPFDAEQIEERVEKRRTMSGREDESIASRPLRIVGIEA